MTGFDVLLLGVLAVFLVWGYFRGILGSVGALLGLVGGVYVANRAFPVAQFYSDLGAAANAGLAPQLYSGIVIGSLLLGPIILKFLIKWTGIAFPSRLDSLGGAIIHAGVGVLFAGLTIALLPFYFADVAFLNGSVIGPKLFAAADTLFLL